MRQVRIRNRIARFSSLPWTDLAQGLEVVVGGAGGIGSWLALFLGRLQCVMYIYDYDKVDEFNLGGQLFRDVEVGQDKTFATHNLVNNYAGITPITRSVYYDELATTTPVMFSAFDNMVARKIMFSNWKKKENRELFIDGRMLAENMQVFAVTPGERELEYEKHLFNDNDVKDAACTSKATSHCGAMIASLMTSTLTNYLANKFYGQEIRELPFEIKFDIESMSFNTDNKNYSDEKNIFSDLPQGEQGIHTAC